MKSTRHRLLTWCLCVAGIAVCAAALLAGAFTAQSSLVDRFDEQAYSAALARRVASVADIVADYEWQQYLILPLAPPDPNVPFPMPGGTLPLEPNGFSEAFLDGLLPAVRNGITVYPITVNEDPLTQARVIRNMAGQELARVPAPVDYDPLWYVEAHTPGLAVMDPVQADWFTGVFDPSRIAIAYDLILEDALVQQVWQMSLMSGPPEGGDEEEGEGTNAPLSNWSGVVSNLQFVQIARMETNLQLRLTLAYPEGFTNRIAVITGTSLVVPNWALFFTTNTSESTNAVIFFDANFTTNNDTRFYKAYNADHDSDGDGIPDVWEILHGLNPADSGDGDDDSDGDGFFNLEEYQSGAYGTDPTDPNSHPTGAIYVATTGSDTTGVGTYVSPYASVSTGITHAVTGNRVVILPGEYTGAGNRGLEFAGKAILVTGIAGRRDDTEINCQGEDRGFYFRNDETTNSVLRSLTVKNGSAGNGGGIRCNNADPVIYNCRIKDCEATDDGGGIFADTGAQPRIEHCEVEDCTADNNGGGIYLRDGGTISDSDIHDNTAVDKGGGIYLNSGGSVIRSTVRDNESEDRGDFNGGGGIFMDSGGFVANSTISGNFAYFGGGIYCKTNNPILSNCFIVDNEADNRAGGVYVESSGTLTNCTITANQAHEYGGGLYVQGNATVNNTIIYHNRAAVEPNRYNTIGGTKTYRNCATTPSVGVNPVTSAPLLAGRENPHLLAASPCINTGTNAFASGMDIDGEARVYNGTVDIGCDEYTATNLLGAFELEIDIVGGVTGAVVNTPLTFEADTAGRIERMEWRIETGTGLLTITNAYAVTYAWTTPGTRTVTLWATNSSGTTSTAVTLDIRSGYTNYVSPSGGNVWPFDTWAHAATTIADAVAAAHAGGTVIVTNGTYHEDNIVIEKPLTVRTVNGASTTFVQGDGSDRIFRLDGPGVLLQGFTITRGGGKRRAGGVYIRNGGVVQSCTITDNEAINDGGGVFLYCGGTVTNCIVANNTSGSDAGGVRIDYGGLVTDCIITNNTTHNRGGGVHLHRFGTVRNTVIKRNTQSNATDGVGGGLAFRNGWTNALVEFCTLEANTGFEGGGAHIESEGVSDDGVDHGRAILRNCSIIGNTAVNRAGGVNAQANGDVKNSVIIDNATLITVNDDEPDGGGARVGGGARLMNCTIADNNAGINGRGDGVRCQSDGYVRNCIIYFNDTGNTSIQSGGTGNIQFTCALGLSGGTGNITGNPNFVNRALDNYRITGTPCQNAGNDSYVDTGDVDLDSKTRKVGTVDMGAYEVQ